MSAAERSAEPAEIFAALGEPTRLALMQRLWDGEIGSITGLTAGTDLTRQAVTKHLKVLEKAGLATAARVGRERRYRARAEPVEDLRDYLDGVARQWEDALSRLRVFVER